MMPLVRRIPSTTRLLVLTGLLAVLTAWLAQGNAAMLPWSPRWYLPVHFGAELFSIVVAMLVFVIGGHSVDGRIPATVALLSPAALAVGLLDIGHLLSMPGMPGLARPASVADGLAFWLLARGAGAVLLLAAALVPPGYAVGRRGYRWGVLCALALAAGGYWLVLARPGLIPATFVPGQGPSAFKVHAEYALMALNACAAMVLLARARRTHARADRYLAAGAAIMGLSGVSFTLYLAPDDVFNMVGHAYKAIAYLCLHRAIFVDVVQAPYRRLRMSEQWLAESRNEFRSLMECAPDAILLSGAEGRVSMMNARAEELFGVGRAVAAGLPLELLLPPAEGEDEMRCRRLYGPSFPAEVRRAATPDGQQIAIVRDLSERRRLERALVEQLAYDALTGLPNRHRVLEMLGDAIAAARQERRTLAVLVLDIDAFRKINSNYGWASGDQVLHECVARIAPRLGTGDALARQGGNEFIVVQKHSSREAAAALADSLLDCMRAPFLLDGQRALLSASVGIAVLPPGPCTPSQLVQMAQLAMADARSHGAARISFHTAEMARSIRERIELEAMLSHALERGQLVLQYQPRISLGGSQVVGIEALVRWRHPVLGLVPPARFIPLAEETGMIEDIDLWVLREACTRAAAWHAEGLPLGRVSVNLSARKFQQAGLAQRVRRVLEDSGLDPARLELEITESTVMHDTEDAAAVLRSLKALGVTLSIDDFGTGYSSLSYLKRFPLDVLKIDRSFVKDVVGDPNDAAITRAIIALAHGLNLEAVAEGVETAEQANFLKDNGCDEIQGYYYSPPVWPEQLPHFLLSEFQDLAG